jgi:predicted DNA-binding ribbon-helix-helix protein
MSGGVPFGPPRKRSVTIAGHETSVSLEPMFWQLLEQAANDQGVPLSGLIARIDAERLGWRPTPNLTSALRQWLLRQALGGGAN